MPRRQPRYPEKPWKPDPVKWAKVLEWSGGAKLRREIEPKGGWQLWDWKTLEDRPQDENARPC